MTDHHNLPHQHRSLLHTEEGQLNYRKPAGTQCNGVGKSILVIGTVILMTVFGILAFAVPSEKYESYDLRSVHQEGLQENQLIHTVSEVKTPPFHLRTPLHAAQEKNGNHSKPDVSGTKDGIENINGIDFCVTPACKIAAAQLNESIDLTVDPCDDFYEFACGGWIENHDFPIDGRVGVYDEVNQLVLQRLSLILGHKADPGDPPPLHMTRIMYSTCLDTDTMETLGVAPLLKSLELQGGWPLVLDVWDSSRFDLQSVLVNLRDILVFPLIKVDVMKNLHNTSENIIGVDAGNVPLSVNLMSNLAIPVRLAYKKFMNTVAKHIRDELGQSVEDKEIAKQIDEVIQFEIDFSKMVINASHASTDHVWLTNVTELQEFTDQGTPGMFNWLSYLKQTFSRSQVVITEEDPVLSFNGPYFSYLSDLIATTDSRTLANAMGWRWIFQMAQETTEFLRNAELDFLSVIGASPPNRTIHCTTQTQINLGYAISRDYVDDYFSPSTKEEAMYLIEDIRTAFGSLLEENTWMMPSDVEVAKDKLDSIEAFVAYPDWILDDDELTLYYIGLDLINKEQYDNLVKIGKWFDQLKLQSLREEPEKRFALPPTLVNGYYKVEDNSITITAGILQNPYFSHDSLAALNYGGIGFFMGHEMTHGFDSIGRNYDKNGDLVQWWSNETIEAYNERAMCFVKQYNHFYPPELIDAGINVSVNGLRTLPENTADNVGIREAYKAYELYVDRNGEEARLIGLEEFSPDQLFYLGFAYPMCVHSSANMMLKQLSVDAHSPGRFRVLGPLSNDKNFSSVWNCPVGSPMNRGEDSCVLW